MRLAIILILLSTPALAKCPCGTSLNADGACVVDMANVCPPPITRQMLQDRINAASHKNPGLKKPEVDQTKAPQ
jgi:hypothetical protein